jgi:hypothetical protein
MKVAELLVRSYDRTRSGDVQLRTRSCLANIKEFWYILLGELGDPYFSC